MSNFAIYYEFEDGHRNLILLENLSVEEAIVQFEDYLIEEYSGTYGESTFDVLDEYWVISSNSDIELEFSEVFDEKYGFKRYA